MRINLDNFKQTNIKSTIVVAGGDDLVVLEALNDANKKIVLDVILIGDKNKIDDMVNKYSFKVKEIINEVDPIKIGELAVQCIKENKANVIMKGLIDTKFVLKAVVNSSTGIKKQKMLSHVTVIDYPDFNSSLIVSDCAMNINPNAEDK
jgi:phosphate butyryltransferase